MRITRKAEFSASHRCYLPTLSEQENQQLYGRAANPNGHGHNYTLEVTLEGPVDAQNGMIFDLKQLKEIINEEVIDPMDHRHLNHEVPPFDKVVPTTENIAAEIWRRLDQRIAPLEAKLYSIRLYETDECYVELVREA